MKRYVLLSFALIAAGLVSGCGYGPKSGRGFVFPEGNIERGQKAFVDLKCYTCHRVDGVASLPAPEVAAEKVVMLGGEVARLRTYGDLVTSVIHPSYDVSVAIPGMAKEEKKISPMKPVNDTMTVTQMLDIVTFLHPRYKELQPLYDSKF